MYQFTIDQYFDLRKRGLMAYGYYAQQTIPTKGETPVMFFNKEGDRNKKYVVAYNIPDGTYVDPDITFEDDPLVEKRGVDTFFDDANFINTVRKVTYEQALILVDAYVKAVREKLDYSSLAYAFEEIVLKNNNHKEVQAPPESIYPLFSALYGDSIRNNLSDKKRSEFFDISEKYKEKLNETN